MGVAGAVAPRCHHVTSGAPAPARLTNSLERPPRSPSLQSRNKCAHRAAASAPDTSCGTITIRHQNAGKCLSQQCAGYVALRDSRTTNTVTHVVTATHNHACLAP